ncbi:MAG: response regulator, partial [Elusimicrobia bacterium]|nr:response regulator [Elusimicrobiota bacterium]
ALVDLDGRRLYSSPSYRILGNLGALRGSDSFNEIHPEDREKIKLVFEETLRTGVGQRAEYRFLLKDGSIRFIESQGDVIRDKSGKIERIVVVSRDVTERKKMEEKEKLLQQQLLQAEKLKSLGETLAGVAHELNNPLTGIIGFCELLLQAETVKQHPQTRQDIEEIFKQSQRCKRIIQGLSTFARRHKPSKKLIAINAMIEDCLRLEAYHFRTKNIKIHPTLGPDLPDTMADDHQLQQVLLNLFINAYQAIKKHREHGNLYVRTSHRSGFIRLEIEDDGPGIPAENLNRIFEPFFTTKDIGQGTGLGLSICYGIIREHGGKIWAESPPGRGALFVVELPIVQEAEPEPEPEAAPELNLPTGLKVLVVDDEQVVQTVLRRVLSQMNARIEDALDGHAAVDKLERNDYDAIICDVNMPGIDGRKLYQWVQENKPHLLSRWIFITGSVTEQTQQFLIDTGRPIIKKPFDIRRIQEALQDLF